MCETLMKNKSLNEKLLDWLKKKKNTLVGVVASLIATMGFQIGVNPPGGVWQDDNYLYDKYGNPVDPWGNPTTREVDAQNKTVPFPHKAGYAVLATRDREGYQQLYIFNTVGLFCSLSLIFLITSGLPVRNTILIWILIVILWLAISAMAATYIAALRALTPERFYHLENSIAYSVYGWMGLTFLYFITRVIRLLPKMVRRIWRGLVKVIGKLTGRSSKAYPSAAPLAV